MRLSLLIGALAAGPAADCSSLQLLQSGAAIGRTRLQIREHRPQEGAAHAHQTGEPEWSEPLHADVDGDNGEVLEVVVRRTQAHRPPVQQTVSLDGRRRRHDPHPGVAGITNASTDLAVKLSEDMPMDRRAAASPKLPQLAQGSGKPGTSGGASAAPGPLPANTSPVRALELIIGILLGILVSLLAILACQRFKAQPGGPQGVLAATLMPSAHSVTLDGGRLGLVQLHYQGAFFNQLSWTLEGGAQRRDREREYLTMVLNERSQKVARAVGRLMSTPNGEIRLSSLGGAAGSTPWCTLKRPAPSRRPGQLWDFKVCQANGAAYLEVRQRSETKCLVNDADSQRRMMTVIGNFTYPVFLSGERSIHVWITQADGQSLMGAQCEAKIQRPEDGASDSSRRESLDPPAENMLQVAPAARRFYVTTTANTDASLVLAVLLGLQDVHRAADRAARRGECLDETSSASTGSAWQAHRVSSDGSTAATSAAGGREHSRRESAKAAPAPPPESTLPPGGA